MGLSDDLGTVAGFNQLTSGAVSGLAAAFGVNPADWDIREATYTGGGAFGPPQTVKFHVFKNSAPFNDPTASTPWNGALTQIADTGGRRKVKYQFPYRDGQTTDDLGRRPESFELDILIFGDNYMDCFNSLIRQFNDPSPGYLVHPVRGVIRCGVDTYTLTHSSDKRKAMGIRVVFIEHTYDISNPEDISSSLLNSIKGALGDAMKVFAIIDAGINKINQALAFSAGVKALLNSYMAIQSTQSADVLSQMNAAFNSKGGSADIPGLLPVNVGGSGQTFVPPSVIVSPESVLSLGKGLDASTFSKLKTSFGGVVPNLVTVIPTASTTSSNAKAKTFQIAASINDPFNSVPVTALSKPTAIALAVAALTKKVQAMTRQTAALITAIEANGGALELFDTIISLRQQIVLIQNVLRAGVASSKSKLKTYVVPRTMSLREVCFINGIALSRIQDIDQLNPTLLSVNNIDPGTKIMVPSA